MCGNGEKVDRRPVDPPPIIQVLRSPSRLALDEGRQEHRPYYLMYAILVDAQTRQELLLLRDNKTRATTGQVVSPLYKAIDIDQSEGYFFVFPDLSVRSEGEFCFKFMMFQMDETTGQVTYIDSVLSDSFKVYAAKRFPGMNESTQLSRLFAEQGIKIRIRKELRKKKSDLEQQGPSQSSTIAPSLTARRSPTMRSPSVSSMSSPPQPFYQQPPLNPAARPVQQRFFPYPNPGAGSQQPFPVQRRGSQTPTPGMLTNGQAHHHPTGQQPYHGGNFVPAWRRHSDPETGSMLFQQPRFASQLPSPTFHGQSVATKAPTLPFPTILQHRTSTSQSSGAESIQLPALRLTSTSGSSTTNGGDASLNSSLNGGTSNETNSTNVSRTTTQDDTS